MASDLHVQCGNGHWVLTDAHADPDMALECPPGEGCCDGSRHPGLSHGAAAIAGHPHGVAGDGQADHDGPHGVDNPDCAVCRPVTITGLQGCVETLQPAIPGSK
jgi:hypothetical protein